jgi:hypothetical protein
VHPFSHNASQADGTVTKTIRKYSDVPPVPVQRFAFNEGRETKGKKKVEKTVEN